jgi:hypothetical protein
VAAQELTWTLLVLLVEQVVVVQLLPEEADAFEHDDTAVGPVVTTLQVVVVQLLPELAVTGVHDETPVGPVVVIGQLVAV